MPSLRRGVCKKSHFIPMAQAKRNPAPFVRKPWPYAEHPPIKGCAGNALHDGGPAHPLTAQLIDDQNYRIRAAGYASLVLNILLALSRGVIGWLTSSVWLIVLAGYYLALCVAKAWLLQRDRKIARETDSAVRERREFMILFVVLGRPRLWHQTIVSNHTIV